MKALLSWLDERSGIGAGLCWCGDCRIAGRACCCRSLPAAIFFALVMQAITGFFIWSYYSAGAQSAWESVYYLQYQVAGGWLLRAMHHYSGQAVIALAGLYVLQLIFTGRYRAPRELVFWCALLLGTMSLCMALTGDLLAWDQNSVSSTQTRVSFLNLLPVVGGYFYKIAAGGAEFGNLTLTRFLALHVGAFTALFFGIWMLHALFSHRAEAADIEADGGEATEKTSPWWPNQTLINVIVCLVVLAVVMGLSLSHGIGGPHAGVALGSPGDPITPYDAARPEWAFRGLYEFSHLFPGTLAILPIFVIPGTLFVVFLAMPFIGRGKAGHLFNMGLTAVLTVGLVILSAMSWSKDAADPKHQAAIAAEEQTAERAVELVQAYGGAPATGARTLLRDDPKIQGPLLFKQHCASCHDYVDVEGQGIKAEESSAPNLHGYATRKWIAGWLDPEQVGGPNYFGNTAFKKGDMVSFIDETLSDLDDDEKAEIQQIAMTLSAQAKLKAQIALDKKEADKIEEGRELIGDYGCNDCHKFHDEGSLGDAPDLTGYGSREWTVGIIRNPAHKRFYSESNDRMPAYAEQPGDAPANMLTTKQVGLIADWLRGEWFTPAEK